MRLNIEQTAVLVIDVQEKLFPVMQATDALVSAVGKLLQGAQALELPILLTEQYPRGLGNTVAGIRDIIPDIEAIEKRSFSCCGSGAFMAALNSLNKKQILVSGIETHVCVFQTCMDLNDAGYDVFLMTDAVSSRKISDKELALRVLEKENIHMRSVEMALFELLQTSRHDKFKRISSIIK